MNQIANYVTPGSAFLSGKSFGGVHNLDVTVCCKRALNFYEGTLWRDDYGVDIRYMWGERDMAYNVPYIEGLVASKSDSRRLFLRKRQGRVRPTDGCLVGGDEVIRR
eukprot:CAMPEP_0118645442 /NCGR_PEP_ID=MMETSP0785-20121206/7508_1 /TAXON_ID=91992 /ORGANISM="Bolidomonas pacifica, Strain CCMP 1866" /LENGTH=106 /DNA_ID=CAMNT_0006537335 /DNA_START=844 /DNA_END=1162 /DNA_ORIENTATION=+